MIQQPHQTLKICRMIVECYLDWLFERHIFYIISGMGMKGDWDFWISDLVKNPDGTDI